MPIRRLADFARNFSLLAYAAWAIVIAFKPISTPDYWWQRQEGINFLKGISSPGPLHAFGLPASPCPREYGLYEALVGFFFLAGGNLLVWLAWGFAFLVFFFWLLKRLRPACRNGDLFCLILFPSFLMLYCMMRHRPESLSLIPMIASGWWLVRNDSSRPSPPSWGVLFVFLAAWSNLHSSYIIGLGFLVSWSANQWLIAKDRPAAVRRIVLPSLAVCALAPLFHPDGWRNMLRPFLNQTNQPALAATWEMWPPSPFVAGLDIVLFAGGLILLAATRPRRKNLWLAACLTATFVLSLASLRYGILLAATVLISCLLHAERRRARSPVPLHQFPSALSFGVHLLASALILILCGLQILQQSGPPSAYLKQGLCAAPALDWLSRQKETPLFFCSEWHPASFAQSMGGRLRPLQDSGLGRYDPATTAYYHDLQTNAEAFQDALARLEVDAWVLNTVTAHWLLYLEGHPRWKLAYADEESLVYLRRGDFAAPEISLPSGWRRKGFSADSIQSGKAPQEIWNGALPASGRMRPGLPAPVFTSAGKAEFDRVTFILNQRIHPVP